MSESVEGRDQSPPSEHDQLIWVTERLREAEARLAQYEEPGWINPVQKVIELQARLARYEAAGYNPIRKVVELQDRLAEAERQKALAIEVAANMEAERNEAYETIGRLFTDPVAIRIAAKLAPTIRNAFEEKQA